jgi:hypothetical protein
MTPEEWRDLKVIWEHALELAPADRGAYLEAQQPAVRREIESLIRSYEENSAFLEVPCCSAPAPALPSDGALIRQILRPLSARGVHALRCRRGKGPPRRLAGRRLEKLALSPRLSRACPGARRNDAGGGGRLWRGLLAIRSSTDALGTACFDHLVGPRPGNLQHARCRRRQARTIAATGRGQGGAIGRIAADARGGNEAPIGRRRRGAQRRDRNIGIIDQESLERLRIGVSRMLVLEVSGFQIGHRRQLVALERRIEVADVVLMIRRRPISDTDAGRT